MKKLKIAILMLVVTTALTGCFSNCDCYSSYPDPKAPALAYISIGPDGVPQVSVDRLVVMPGQEVMFFTKPVLVGGKYKPLEFTLHFYDRSPSDWEAAGGEKVPSEGGVAEVIVSPGYSKPSSDKVKEAVKRYRNANETPEEKQYSETETESIIYYDITIGDKTLDPMMIIKRE